MERDKIKQFYSNQMEKDRLELELFKLEGIRTKEIISRHLTKEKMMIADIGGGAGFYAFWLQSLGHNVHLVDLSPRNIELVKERAEKSRIQLTKFEEGDATKLNFRDDQFDLVLLLGPLYHLTDKKERVKALSEAKRIVKPGGFVLAAVISRYASLFDGFRRDLVNDDQFVSLLMDDLKTGIHLNETGNWEYFTTAFFHTPDEIKNEIKESGLEFQTLVAAESFGWIIDNFSEKSEDKNYMNKLNKIINMVETNDDLIAMSPHIIAVSKKIID
ncbi:MAG TPA: class I SAM-dependent methyltransferase [Chitinophagaceae bacterium]|nr:class I SAM-dependent methyltransferase [Chitinophagaceae bacterium]